MVIARGVSAGGAEQRLKDFGIVLPAAPLPLGAYVEAVQSGNLLFLSGILPVVDGKPRHVGRVGVELDLEAGRDAAFTACLNALAVVRDELGSLDKVSRVVRLAVSIVSEPDFRSHPLVADGASELLEAVFGKDKTSTRRALGVVSLPLGAPLELELIFETAQ
ncbi:RidA family protein [Herbaspirillum rhizosphaerae]|uniref:RidA family protein n=1 Tax=Herbaspirillum rhizosphaerae TaxID=346179 RepID=A0ABW8Z7J9_9BURK